MTDDLAPRREPSANFVREPVPYIPHWGIWLVATKAWFRFNNGALFFTTSREVAAAQAQVSCFGRGEAEIRLFRKNL